MSRPSWLRRNSTRDPQKEPGKNNGVLRTLRNVVAGSRSTISILSPSYGDSAPSTTRSLPVKYPSPDLPAPALLSSSTPSSKTPSPDRPSPTNRTSNSPRRDPLARNSQRARFLSVTGEPDSDIPITSIPNAEQHRRRALSSPEPDDARRVRASLAGQVNPVETPTSTTPPPQSRPWSTFSRSTTTNPLTVDSLPTGQPGAIGTLLPIFEPPFAAGSSPKSAQAPSLNSASPIIEAFQDWWPTNSTTVRDVDNELPAVQRPVGSLVGVTDAHVSQVLAPRRQERPAHSQNLDDPLGYATSEARASTLSFSSTSSTESQTPPAVRSNERPLRTPSTRPGGGIQFAPRGTQSGSESEGGIMHFKRAGGAVALKVAEAQSIEDLRKASVAEHHRDAPHRGRSPTRSSLSHVRSSSSLTSTSSPSRSARTSRPPPTGQPTPAERMRMDSPRKMPSLTHSVSLLDIHEERQRKEKHDEGHAVHLVSSASKLPRLSSTAPRIVGGAPSTLWSPMGISSSSTSGSPVTVPGDIPSDGRSSPQSTLQAHESTRTLTYTSAPSTAAPSSRPTSQSSSTSLRLSTRTSESRRTSSRTSLSPITPMSAMANLAFVSIASQSAHQQLLAQNPLGVQAYGAEIRSGDSSAATYLRGGKPPRVELVYVRPSEDSEEADNLLVGRDIVPSLANEKRLPIDNIHLDLDLYERRNRTTSFVAKSPVSDSNATDPSPEPFLSRVRSLTVSTSQSAPVAPTRRRPTINTSSPAMPLSSASSTSSSPFVSFLPSFFAGTSPSPLTSPTDGIVSPPSSRRPSTTGSNFASKRGIGERTGLGAQSSAPTPAQYSLPPPPRPRKRPSTAMPLQTVDMHRREAISRKVSSASSLPAKLAPKAQQSTLVAEFPNRYPSRRKRSDSHRSGGTANSSLDSVLEDPTDKFDSTNNSVSLLPLKAAHAPHNTATILLPVKQTRIVTAPTLQTPSHRRVLVRRPSFLEIDSDSGTDDFLDLEDPVSSAGEQFASDNETIRKQ